MKFLVLLSLVAFGACLPASFEKHVEVDIRSINNNVEQQISYRNQPYQFWNKQRYFEEPKNQWVNYEDVKPWLYGYRNVQELNNLSPIQRVELLLEHFRALDQWNHWNKDVNEEYLYKKLYNYLPERVFESNLEQELLVPELVRYFEQNPLKYEEILEDVWSPEQFLWNLENYLVVNRKDLPWSHEEILKRALEHQKYFPINLSLKHLEEFVNFVYFLQFELVPSKNEGLFEKFPLEHERLGLWERFFHKLSQEKYDQQYAEIKLNPWTKFFYQVYQQTPRFYQQWRQPESSQWTRLYQNLGYNQQQRPLYPWSPAYYQEWEQRQAYPWTPVQREQRQAYPWSPVQWQQRQEYPRSPLQLQQRQEYSWSPVQWEQRQEYPRSPLQWHLKQEYPWSPVQWQQEQEYQWQQKQVYPWNSYQQWEQREVYPEREQRQIHQQFPVDYQQWEQREVYPWNGYQQWEQKELYPWNKYQQIPLYQQWERSEGKPWNQKYELDYQYPQLQNQKWN